MFFKKCTIRSLAYLLLMLQGLDELHAQTNNFTYKLSLDSVSFAGTGLIRIRNDDNTFFYDAPHWTTRLQKPKPVGYRSGAKPSIRSIFKIEGVCNTNVFVKGEGPNGITFPIQLLSLNAARTNAIYDSISNIAFENGKVNYFEKFNITWSYTADTSTLNNRRPKWAIVGASTNELYVTKGKPLQIYDTGVDTATFHTVINIGCKYATGETIDSVIVAKVYKQFQTLNIMSVDNRRPLQYWGDNYGSRYISSIPNGNIDHLYFTKGLLKHSEGTCNAWSLFFIETLRTQGIGNAEFIVLRWTSNEKLGTTNANVLAINLSNAGLRATNTSNLALLPAKFFVKNWDSGGDKFVSLDSYDNTTYRPGNLMSEIDRQGIKAQSMENPWSIFENHVVVRYKEVFYDPSYGSKPTKLLTELKTNSISFFGTSLQVQEVDQRNAPSNWYIWIKPSSTSDNLMLTVVPQHLF